MNPILDDLLVNDLSLETLEIIDKHLRELVNSSILTESYKERLREFREDFSSVNTKHIKTKNIILYHIDKILEHVTTDYSQQVSEKQRAYCNSITKRLLLAKGVYLSNICRNSLELLSNNNLDSFDRLQYIEDKEILETICSILRHNYNITISLDILLYIINNSQSAGYEEGLSRMWHKGGTSVRTYSATLINQGFQEGQNEHIVSALYLLFDEVRKYKSSNTLIYDSYTNLDVLASKITGLLIHLHYSGGKDIPLPRVFLERAGYERLTSLKSVSLNREEEVNHSSLYVLEYLGFITITPYSEDTCREYSLTPLGEAVVAGLALFYKGKLPVKELILLPGDLTSTHKDYDYYIIKEGFIPDTEIIDTFLTNLDKTTINLTSYVNGFKEICPSLNLSKEAYVELVIDHFINNDEYTNDFTNLCDFDRDINLICTGYKLTKFTKGKNKHVHISYRNVWRLAYTGRLFQRYGSQGISKKSKTIVHKDYINYDIPNSQLMVLVQFIEDITNKYSSEYTTEDWSDHSRLMYLKEYIKDPSVREEIIKNSGVSKEQWKKVVYSLVFGANVNNLHKRTSLGSIIFLNSNNPYFNKDEFILALTKMWKPIRLWLKYVQRYVQDFELTPLQESRLLNINPSLSGYTNQFVYNGLVFVNKNSEKFLNKAKASSFFLQGLETSFILKLSELLPTHTISYEFDGLVTDKPIHEELLEEARRLSGFRYGTVIIKPFE